MAGSRTTGASIAVHHTAAARSNARQQLRIGRQRQHVARARVNRGGWPAPAMGRAPQAITGTTMRSAANAAHQRRDIRGDVAQYQPYRGILPQHRQRRV
jgi:hypothetical protein